MKGQLDLSKVAVAGQSCGGIEALVAGSDPRVTAVLALSTGFFPDGRLGGYKSDELKKLHSPVMVMEGDPKDIAYQNAIANYADLTVPAIHVSNPDGEHTGFWHNTRHGEAASDMTAEADLVLTNYLGFVLNGQDAARHFFLAPKPGLEPIAGWTTEHKNY